MRLQLPTTLLSLAFALLPNPSQAVFADDAYTIDYHHALLGLPLPSTTFFHRPRKDEKATLLYTLSDLGVLGAVHPGKGDVVWRQLLVKGNATEGYLRPVEGEGIVVSGLGNKVNAWNAESGRAIWENEFKGEVRDVEIMETAASTTSTDEAKDILTLLLEDGKTVVRKLRGTNGDVIWEYRDSSDDVPVQVSTNLEHVFVVSLHGSWGGYNLKILVLDPLTGKKSTDYSIASKADVHSAEDVLLVGANSAAPFVAWTDNGMKNLKVNVLGKPGSLQTLPLKECDGEITKVEIHAPHLVQSLPHFLVHSQSAVSNRADVYHVDLKSGSISKEYELPKLLGQSAISTSSQESNVFFTRTTDDEVTIVSSRSHGILGRWPVKVEKQHGSFLHGVSEVISKTVDSFAVRSAVLSTNQNWVLIRNGAEAWARPEGLSGIIAADWADIPESENLVKALEEEAQRNPLSAYIHRVNRHASDLQYLPGYLQALPGRLLSSIISGEATAHTPGVLTRDNFGFNKLVIVATKRARVYALDSGNQGAIVWSSTPFEMSTDPAWTIKSIWVNQPKGVAALQASAGEHVTINVTTGEVLRTHKFQLPEVETAVPVDSAGGTWLLPIGPDGSPGILPAGFAPKDLLVVQGKDGEVKGVKLEANGNLATPALAWTFQPGSGEKVVNVVSRPKHDPVASIGRVLGDRTVLYKYLNPNIVLVTTVSEVASSATFYLLDSVSGEVLYSTTHEGVDTTQPITSALTENWFVYSLWSDTLPSTTALPASKGYQLVVSELYESEVPNDRGPLAASLNASSLEPSEFPNAEPALPYVITQSFLVPESISHMSITQTRQGITTRQLICTLTASNAVVGIPRTLLDPRRPVGRDPTAAEQEEGLFRYHPVINFDPQIILTHKREVIGIENVIATPALLESTSLLFAYGIDIFGTRVAPSMAFDILGKNFNRISLVATVLALGAGVAVAAPLVRRKQINGRWQTA